MSFELLGQVRTFRIAIAALLAVIGLGEPLSAQSPSLAISFFKQNLDSIREQANIPGMSAAIVQNGAVVWEQGFGRQDVDANIAASPDTPYFIADLSQTLGSTLVLKKCLTENSLELNDKVTRWDPSYPEPDTTVEQLLSHVAPSGQFVYDGLRFEKLTPVVEECADKPYRLLLFEEIFDRFGMINSVPGRSLEAPNELDSQIFAAPTLSRYSDVLRRLAVPYRLDQGRALRSQVSVAAANTANGVITSVHDYARFDLALRSGALLGLPTLQRAWTQSRSGGTPLPTGLGWFVQNYNGEPLVWHLGFTKDAYSSLILKLPSRDLTLILMANSDGLGNQLALDTGDITASTFARLVLRYLVQ